MTVETYLNDDMNELVEIVDNADLFLRTRSCTDLTKVDRRRTSRHSTILLQCQPYHQSSRLLRSSSQSLLHVPRIKTSDFGRRAFSSAAPQICNYHIPTAIRVSPPLDSFKRHLKTHYFASPPRNYLAPPIYFF